jgi:methyl-accepting chemotaxis protein
MINIILQNVYKEIFMNFEKKSSLKFRFVLSFTAFIIAMCVFISFISIQQAVQMTSSIFVAQGNSITEKAISLIDGDSFEALAKSLDKDDPFYEDTRLKLLGLKQLSGCKYLYTMSPSHGNVWKYIIDGSATPDDTKHFSALGREEDISSYGELFIRAYNEKATQITKLEKQEEWGWMLSIYAPILNSAEEAVGTLGCDFTAGDIVAALTKQIVIQIITGLIFIVIGIILMLVFLRMIFKRLKTINEILREIAAGEGDLTGRIEIQKNDEIGELAHYFNLTLEKIKNLVSVIKNQAVNLFNIGNELAENMQQTANAINHITGNIQTVKEKVISQSASVNESSATMEQVTLNIKQLNGNVEEQTASVAQSSSAIEQMLANIQSVTRTLVQNAENMQELTEASEIGRGGLQTVSQDIHEIARESEGLMEINAVMNNIASQTNLLSMNAAIEAAHAGEAGKGFAVVADEIRKLAENSGRQSKIISDTLKKIIAAIEAITKSANTVLEKFQAIDSRIKIVSDQETNIRKAMEEQDLGSRQILEAIGRLNELTRMVKDGSAKMLEGSKEVIEESKNLEMVTSDITGGMSEISESANEIDTAVNRVNEISGMNKNHIDSLVAEVSKFKIE